MGRPSRSAQPPLADHRAIAPRMTRSPGNPAGPSLTVMFGTVLSLYVGVTVIWAGLRPGWRPPWEGKHDCFDGAERRVRLVRQVVVDRLDAVLHAECGDAVVEFVQHDQSSVVVD